MGSQLEGIGYSPSWQQERVAEVAHTVAGRKQKEREAERERNMREILQTEVLCCYYSPEDKSAYRGWYSLMCGARSCKSY